MATYGDQDIICPFYKSFAKQNIKCEGLFKRSSISLSTQDINSIKDWKKNFCESINYTNCPIAKMLTEKYEKRA